MNRYTKPNQSENAIRSLHDRGGQFVMLRIKKPIYKGYQRRIPGVDSVLHHVQIGLDIGIFPCSLSTTALDVDFGNIGELVLHEPPLTILPTPRGSHLYYEDDVPRGNGKFDLFGCRGDIRSAKGYLKLHPGGAEKLAHALDTTPAGSAPFPRDLFDGTEWAPRPGRAKTGRVVAMPSLAPPGGWVMEDVPTGQRHIAVFDVVRWWAYAQDKGNDLTAWIKQVGAFAQSQNQRLPEPQDDTEVYWKIAYSIAMWTWDGGGALDHSTWAQRRRGVKSYYGNARPEQIMLVEQRHDTIRELDGLGWTQTAIADQVGLSPDPTAGRRRSPCARRPSFVPTPNPNPSRSIGTGFR